MRCGWDGPDSNPSQGQGIQFVRTRLIAPSHVLHETFYLMVPAQCLIDLRRGPVGDDFAAYAQHPERGFMGPDVETSRGLGLLPGFLQRLGAALGPVLNAGNEVLGRLFERFAIGGRGILRHCPPIRLNVSGGFEQDA